jgi:hypothetical protein
MPTRSAALVLHLARVHATHHSHSLLVSLTCHPRAPPAGDAITKMEVTTSLALALTLTLALPFVFVLALVLSLALAYVPRRLLAYVPRRLLHFVQRMCTWLHGAQPRLQACRPTGKHQGGRRGGRQRVRSFFQMAKNAEAVEAHRLCQAACHA